jgi:hypothetical protein
MELAISIDTVSDDTVGPDIQVFQSIESEDTLGPWVLLLPAPLQVGLVTPSTSTYSEDS